MMKKIAASRVQNIVSIKSGAHIAAMKNPSASSADNATAYQIIYCDTTGVTNVDCEALYLLTAK
jgi:hypothetical protein